MYTVKIEVPIIDQAKRDALDAIAPGLTKLFDIPLTVDVKDAVAAARKKLSKELLKPEHKTEYVDEALHASTPQGRGVWVVEFRVRGD